MKIVSWNMRGLNSKGKQKQLKEKWYTKHPSIMLIYETKILSEVQPHIIRKWGRNFQVVVIDA